MKGGPKCRGLSSRQAADPSSCPRWPGWCLGRHPGTGTARESPWGSPQLGGDSQGPPGAGQGTQGPPHLLLPVREGGVGVAAVGAQGRGELLIPGEKQDPWGWWERGKAQKNNGVPPLGRGSVKGQRSWQIPKGFSWWKRLPQAPLGSSVTPRQKGKQPWVGLGFLRLG